MLTLKGVSFAYPTLEGRVDSELNPETWILRDVSLNVRRQESLVVVGTSGSGKSTFLKLLAGLLVPTQGEIERATSNVGMLFQKNALFDSVNVLENLLFPLREVKGMTGNKAHEAAMSMLTAVGLDAARDLFPDEISGGMQKRLGIARALIVEPELILYDEPTAGLDPITSQSIATLILDLKKQRGSTLVTVTNDVHRAYALGDRIGIFVDGKWIEGGTPLEVRRTVEPHLKQFFLGELEGPLTADL